MSSRNDRRRERKGGESPQYNSNKKAGGYLNESSSVLDLAVVVPGAPGKVLWNNSHSAVFPTQQKLIEDEFRKAQVLDFLEGEEEEDYEIDHPKPLFCFALAIPKSPRARTRAAKAKETGSTWHQPDADPNLAGEDQDMNVLADMSTYYTMLVQYNTLYAAWEKRKSAHDKKVRTFNIVFDTVFGPSALQVMLNKRREHGMAVAWKHLKAIYAPDDKSNMAIGVVVAKWESMRKVPHQSMAVFLSYFDQVHTELKDLGRVIDNTDLNYRLKVALMYDDVNYEKHWGLTMSTATKEVPLSDADFMAHMEKALNDKAKEIAHEKQSASIHGTYSSQVRDQNRLRDLGTKEVKKHANTVLPETAMAAETEPKKQTKVTAEQTSAGKGPEAASAGKPKPKCYRCGATGHVKKHCKNKLPEEANVCEEFELGDSDDGVTIEFGNLAVEEFTAAAAAEGVPKVVPKYLDSACSSNMTPPTPEMTDFRPKVEKINLAGEGHQIESEGRGVIGPLKDVMVSKQLRMMLVSTSKCDKDNMFTLFGNGRAYVLDEPPTMHGNVIMSGTMTEGGLYQVDDITASIPEPTVAAAEETRTKPYTSTERRLVKGSFGLLRSGSTGELNMKQVLHRRLGHINETAIEELLKNNAVIGAGTTYEAVKSMALGMCDACMKGKMHARHVPTSLSRNRAEMKPMEQIAMDPVPMVKASLQGNTYATIGVDIGTGYSFFVPARTKGEQVDVLKKVMALAERYKHTVKTLHTDSDSVYLDKDFDTFCKRHKIRQEQSTPYIHQENGSAEAMVKTTCDGTRVALIDAQSSLGFWEYAMGMQMFHHNRTLHGHGETKTPFEKLSGVKPDISMLRPFGAHCWAHITDEERAGEGARWAPRAQQGVIVGYSDTVPGAYLVLISTNPPVVRVRSNVVALEGPPAAVIWNMGKPLESDAELIRKDNSDTEDSGSDESSGEDEDEVEEQGDELVIAPRRSARVPVPNKQYANAAVELAEVPKDLNTAMAGPESKHWGAAVQKELDNYHTRGGFKHIDREDIPKGATILDMKKVFKRAKIADNAYKYKFRLAVRGFRQREGVDYTDTYSPTIMVKTVMTVLHLAAHYGWDNYHIDVGCAYMEAPPDRVMYIRMGKDLQQHKFAKGEYAVLGTNAYGTKQAGRVWYLFMAGVLIDFMMTRAAADVCLFYKWNEDHTKVMIVVVYVDDFGVTGNWVDEIERFFQHMRAQYTEIKVEAPMAKYVGLELTWDKKNRTVLVGQQQYAKETVAEFVSEDTRVTNSPLPHTVDFKEPLDYTEEPIWDIVGKVRFLADRTRPEIAVATGLLGSYQKAPAVRHVRGAQHLLRYLKGTTEAKLKLGGKGPVLLQGAVDASFDNKYQCKPMLGYVLYLGESTGAVLWKAKRATTMAQSVGEAETRAAAEATREIVWMRGLLEELGEKQKTPTVLRSDSQAMIDITKDFANNPRTGCFNRDVQWLRQCIEDGTIALKKVAGTANEADLMTKLLAADITEGHAAKIRGTR